MSDELNDEVISINSIYDENTLSLLSGHMYALSLPTLPAISFRVEFPADYPDAPPSILGTQTVGESTAKGEGSHLVDLIRHVLAEIYVVGAPCVFDLVEEVEQRLQQRQPESSAEQHEEPQAAQRDGQPSSDSDLQRHGGSSDAPQPQCELEEPPPWVLSEVLSEKKSIFLARCAPVTSVVQAQSYLAHLLSTDKKVAKATHNITAWRIRGDNGVQYQDCDDDGETAAGGRVLHLMELMGVWDVMVVGARDALVKGGFVEEAGKGGGGKKKGKK
ncbi:hypothetical protein LTR02_007742 [Friedmanniomyces endolithicus]|nr:hypothetical protein LTR94_005699 [Friedmanniomyces endolithicus]KAK0809316.1 hypothetical protein LTR59_002560 [Friedmanniomyces endolithicus]KAK0819650.1 hypothetical protein LTR38_000403 [Friedmanniomyces endolithicus]KAK0873251.1 hypothetical protein LTS02_000802 [Friedmanniomyces endolithicus]KAK0885751.1 hypothetical protein LTR87_000455 [Friedmanniomyces endolithicus]